MNKELIKKYKAEFEYWLNVGKLQAKFVYNQWVEAPKDIFSYNMVNFVLVIDDEYVEFRKALAEGKIIQQQDYYSKEWIDMKTDKFHGASDTQYEGIYRIKPDEPKFKVGDWVIHNQKFKIVTKVVDGLIDCLDHSPARVMRKDTLELWQPKPGEWCWFHNGTIESLYFYKFYSIISEGYIADIPKDIEHIMTAQIFKYCEPFTGNLPTIIKDN